MGLKNIALPAMKSASHHTAIPNPPPSDAPFIDWALWCAKVGRLTGAWKVFPCVPGDKRPLHKGWQTEAADDIKTVKTMWQNDPEANIGLAIQPGFVAIDTDIYKPGAEATLDEFEKEHGELPNTLESRTARGGYHLIYSTTKTFGNSTGTLPKFGDVRGNGGLIVGPGSVFEGKRYAIENLSLPVALPHYIEGMICESKRRVPGKSDTPAQLVAIDDPRNIEHFKNWCAGKSVSTMATPKGEVAEPCIENQGGNNRLAATGAIAHDYGLSEDVATEIALEHHNPRCEPPWDDDEYDRHFRSGYRSATGQLGCRAPFRDYRNLFKPVLISKATSPRKNRFKIWTVAELRLRKPPVWLLDEMIPEKGYSILYGPPGAFKTFLALDMALSIATGNPWHGRAVYPGRVLYCMGEGSFDADKRINTWLRHRGRTLDETRFKVIEPAPMLRSTSDTNEFISEAERDGPWDLVIVDTIGRVMPGIDDHAGQGARLFTEFTAGLRERLGAATLAITHSPKDRPEALLGSGAYEADADVIYNATIAQKGMRIDLRQHKLKYGAPWERSLGFQRIEAGESMTLAACEPSRTVKDKVKLVSDNYASEFLIALTKAAAKDGTARWPDVAATMISMNGISGAADIRKVRGQIDNWFRRWNRRSEFDTGRRGSCNEVIVAASSSSGDKRVRQASS